MTTLNKVIGYDLIENTDLRELPVKVQANFLKESLLSHQIKLNTFIKDDSFYGQHKSMELFFLAPYPFVQALHKIYPHKNEFALDNSTFPSIFLGLIHGIESPHYSDFSFITDVLKVCKKLGFDFNAKTPLRNDPLMESFEYAFISKKSLYSLKKGFSKNKNIVDLALATRQYELAIEIMEKYKVKPSVNPELTKEDMLLYVTSLFKNSQDVIATKRFDYRASAIKIMNFFHVKDNYSMYDLLINNKDASLKEFLSTMVKEVKIFNSFKQHTFENLKDPDEIVAQKIDKIISHYYSEQLTPTEVEKVKGLLLKFAEKYPDLSDKAKKISIIIEKNILMNNINTDVELSRQKRL